jgi:ribosomal protein S18 acetylase RimI-like enzyme
MKYRQATLNDVSLLAKLNHQLIRDEEHRNPMTVPELKKRMQAWLVADYEAIIFEDEAGVVAYALYRDDGQEIYLRQFFVVRQRRQEGVGQQAMQILFDQIWAKDKRLLVEVLCQNKPAIRFWKKVGFKEYSLALEILPPGLQD